MSHVAKVPKCRIRPDDFDLAAEAAQLCGGRLRLNQKTHKWFGRWVNDYHGADAAYRTMDPKDFGKCDHAIAIEGDSNAYEIGLVKQKDGLYELVYDNWNQGGGLERPDRFGKGLRNFRRNFSALVSERQLKRDGHRVRRIEREDGFIEIEAIVEEEV